MRLPRNAKIFRGQIDAAPFASVFFLIVLLLLINGRLFFTPGVPIALPSVSERLPGTAADLAVVAIDAEGRMYFENQEVRTEEALHWRLRQAVRQAGAPLTLAIQGDESSRLGVTARLMAAAHEFGFTNVLILAQPAPGPRAAAASP